MTVTMGLGQERFAKMCNISLLQVHQGGQGKPGNKKPVLFPKIVSSMMRLFTEKVDAAKMSLKQDWSVPLRPCTRTGCL